MIKQEKINYLKIAGISLLITAIIELAFYIIGSFFNIFMVYCEPGYYECPSQFDMFISYLPFTAIPIFLITFVIYSLIRIWKK